jgi:hypothetical protein
MGGAKLEKKKFQQKILRGNGHVTRFGGKGTWAMRFCGERKNRRDGTGGVIP